MTWNSKSKMLIRSNQFTVNVAVCMAMLLMSIPLFNVVQAQDTGFFKQPYTPDYEIAMANRMKEGINIFLTDYTKKVVKERGKFWNRDLSSPAAYRASVATNRDHLRQIIGAIDQRCVPKMTIRGKPGEGGKIAETNKCTIYRVEWDVMGGLKSEGLLLIPKEK